MEALRREVKIRDIKKMILISKTIVTKMKRASTAKFILVRLKSLLMG